jgi:hypothetical protein
VAEQRVSEAPGSSSTAPSTLTGAWAAASVLVW